MKELKRYLAIAAITVAAVVLLPLGIIFVIIWVMQAKRYEPIILQVFDNNTCLTRQEIYDAICADKGEFRRTLAEEFIYLSLSNMVTKGLLTRDLAPLAAKKPRRKLNPYKDYLYRLTPSGNDRKRKQEEERATAYNPNPGLLPA